MDFVEAFDYMTGKQEFTTRDIFICNVKFE